jgi:hypothetical protein
MRRFHHLKTGHQGRAFPSSAATQPALPERNSVALGILQACLQSYKIRTIMVAEAEMGAGSGARACLMKCLD